MCLGHLPITLTTSVKTPVWQYDLSLCSSAILPRASISTVRQKQQFVPVCWPILKSHFKVTWFILTTYLGMHTWFYLVASFVNRYEHIAKQHVAVSMVQNSFFVFFILLIKELLSGLRHAGGANSFVWFSSCCLAMVFIGVLFLWRKSAFCAV